MRPTCPPPDRPIDSFADLPTEELVAAARGEGASQAWAEIVVRYERLVLGVVGSFRLQEADAADAAANTGLRAMEGLPALRHPDRLGGWLRTIARRECLGVLRHTVFEEPSDVAAAGMPAAEPGPEAVVVACEVGQVITDAMAHLSGRGRQLILALFFLPRASYTTVAADAEMPIGSIGPTRRRALGALRVGLEQAGYGPDALAA
jgi:RNA polymerase sigma factor (sigma-70 family)